MAKITTVEQVKAMRYSFAASVQFGSDVTEENFWKIREQCRTMSGEYTPIKVEGDDPMRFLHVSTDDENKVAYTKDADKGRADVQTRTMLKAYCAKFGLQEPVVDRVVRELQDEEIGVPLMECMRAEAILQEAPGVGNDSHIVYCMHQLENALGRVAELKAHLRKLLG